MSNYQPNLSNQYWEILKLNIDWLKFSETKSALILTVYGILFTIIFTNSSLILPCVTESCLMKMVCAAFGIVSLTSALYAFSCINPVLTNGNGKSIIYFGHISQKFSNSSDYKNHANSIINDEEQFVDHITEQIHSISDIAWAKYTKFGYSLRLFVASIVILIVAIIIHYSK